VFNVWLSKIGSHLGSKLSGDIKITAEVGFRNAIDCLMVLVFLNHTLSVNNKRELSIRQCWSGNFYFVIWSGNMGSEVS